MQLCFKAMPAKPQKMAVVESKHTLNEHFGNHKSGSYKDVSIVEIQLTLIITNSYILNYSRYLDFSYLQ